MPVPLEPLERAVARRDIRLAVFDVALRRHTGQWELDRRIDLVEAIERFATHDAFVDDAGRIRIPLHDPDEPALTGEFLLVDPSPEPPLVTFYDLGDRTQCSLPLAELESSFPAWRCRFWTDAYPLEANAPFLAEFGDPDEDAPPEPVEPTRDRPTPEAIVEAARSELAARRTAERRRRRTAFERLPIAEFIDSHGGLRNVVSGGREVDDFGQQTVILELPDDHHLAGEPRLAMVSGIHPGDIVVIDAASSRGFPVEAEVFAVDEDRIEVGVYWDTADEPGAEAAFDDRAERLSLGTLVSGNRYAAIEAALGTVERTDHAHARYTGDASLTFADDRERAEPDVELNRDQLAAAERALAAEALAVVRTPPGTGARRVLWTVLRRTVEQGGRVCLLAPDDAALRRLLDGAGELTIDDRARQAGYELDRCGPDDPASLGADIVAAPISHANMVPDHEFDLAILDQAAEVSVPGGAVPFAKAGRVVLLGDPMQSPPAPGAGSIDQAIAPSIYEHIVDVYGSAAVVDLRCQYRMNQAIALFPNRTFYDDRLIHGQENRESRVETLDPLAAFQIAGNEHETPTGSFFTDEAVAVALDEIDRLVERGVQAEEIGILTPSSAETGKIRASLQTRDEDLAAGIAVGGLARFRCDARDAMIVSFVRRGEEVEPFWTDRGLAVALTRARKRLALIGDWEAIREDGRTEAAVELATFLADRGLINGSP